MDTANEKHGALRLQAGLHAVLSVLPLDHTGGTAGHAPREASRWPSVSRLSIATASSRIRSTPFSKGIRAVCEARLGELPTIYAVADVCRPELLLEIEGIAFSQQES